MSTLLLFGAGASYGSVDFRGARPPLGKDLFRELCKVPGSIASTVSPELSAVFERNFEEGMSEFFRTRNPDTTQFLREMAGYFTQFEPGPRNLYRQLIELARGHDVVYSTTNYDLLFEYSAGYAGLAVSHRRTPLPDNRIALLKIHGSIHFLPDLLGGQFINCKVDLTNSFPDSAAFGAAIRLASGNPEVYEFCRRETSVAPAIAMYAPGKRVLVSPDYVKRQQEHWRAEVARARDIILIGLRPNPQDEHIWNPLAQASASLRFVGYEADEFWSWAREAGRVNASPMARTFVEALPLIQASLSEPS